MLSRHAVSLALASALVVAGAASAHAGDGPDISKGNCDLMSFCVGVGTNGSNGGSGRGSGEGKQTSSGGKKPVCTVRKADPQPPPGSLFYGGEGKIVYERTCGNGLTTFFAAAPGANVPAVDPAVLAQQAIDKMQLVGPDIASPRVAGRYTVGVPMWMWVNQSATTFGPNTASATAGGVTVTATAKVSKIVWRMGDGATVTCTGAGTAYKASDGMSESPTCGHVYTTTSGGALGGKYGVTATSTWTIDWQVAGGGGETGQLAETRQSQMQVPIGELQVVR
ncbi:ATP/GTP-binding protein [Streptomyces mirabilis]|uniref:ATP/GTP-binding protein n=1 Tax=Streptomyces mirabilis TaxID=68239 RepID=UPI002256E0ED|nr:ATP/GTP-binding protein [Streptomyces mirabilis]MCX4429567.1 ATP/GTP-binding protein [Streptomyces mirabilis]